MRRPPHLIGIGLMLMMAACAMVEPKEVTFLRAAEHHATQEDVRQRLGPPTLTMASGDDAVWVYHAWDWQPGSRNTASGTWCDEYVLSFDTQTVLRRFSHRSQFHGGEAMPEYCVRGQVAATPSAYRSPPSRSAPFLLSPSRRRLGTVHLTKTRGHPEGNRSRS